MPIVGIGLRAPHYRALADRSPAVDFLEAHSENYFGGGAPLAWLERFRRDHRLSLHGVGLSLGSADPIDAAHLDKLAALVDRVEPWLVSEHLSWSSVGGRFANDLLPLPFTAEAVAHLVARIDAVQERLRRPILVENVAAYHRFAEASFEEAAFVAEVARRAGCRVLLDVNNVWVNAMNHGLDPRAYLRAFRREDVGEIHLAGHESDGDRLIDTHGAPVCEAVWDLYGEAIALLGPVPTVVERDANLPPLEDLLAEAGRARAMLLAGEAGGREVAA